MHRKELSRVKRHKTIRKRLIGTGERPRVCVHRSLNHIYVQAIDDIKSATLTSDSTALKSFSKQAGKVAKSVAAEKLGESFAAKLKEKGIQKIAFDRSGYQYHGRIKAFANSIRKSGIQF